MRPFFRSAFQISLIVALTVGAWSSQGHADERVAPYDPLLFTRLAGAKRVTVQRIAGSPVDSCRPDQIAPSDTVACYPAASVVAAPSGRWANDLVSLSGGWNWIRGRSALDSTFTAALGVHFGGQQLNADWIISIKPLSVLIRVGGRPAASAIVPEAARRPLFHAFLEAFPQDPVLFEQVGWHRRQDGGSEAQSQDASAKSYAAVWERDDCSGSGANVAKTGEGEFVYYEDAPTLIGTAQVDYPEEARSQRLEGKVILHVYVDRSGVPCAIKVVRGIDILSDTAVRAVSRWRYEPAKSNHKPIGVWIEVPVEFHP